jgi:hypothetical protein
MRPPTPVDARAAIGEAGAGARPGFQFGDRFVQVLNLNVGIKFGVNGNFGEFSPVGFSVASDDVSTWSDAPVAQLSFRLPPLRHDLQFTVEVFPFLGNGALTEQPCWIYFNGLFVNYQNVKGPHDLVFTVGRDLLNPRLNRLSFVLPNATSPKDLNVGDDLRLLGLAFVRLNAGDPKAPRAPVTAKPA